MADAVIVDAVRTPLGKRNGALAGWHPVDLSAWVLQALVARTGLDPALIDDVIWGCVTQTGEQAGNVGRYAALAAGFPEDVPGVTVDRQCGSSQQAAHFAAAAVASGQCDVVVAGGVESMSRVPMLVTLTQGPGQPYGSMLLDRYDDRLVDQGRSAELVAARWGLSRRQLDEFALASHEKAAAAQDDGRFTPQTVAVPAAGPADPAGEASLVTADQGVRRGGSTEALAGLRSVFREDGVITAGNSSQISDGAAALLIMTSARARELGMRPLARFHTFGLAGADPVLMLTAPIPATAKALRRSGLRLDEIGAFEVNEAFACVPLAWLDETGADPKAVNPNGGAIALGHPLGASGARLLTTLLHHMVDQGVRYGLQTMCERGGTANATILELL